MSVKIISGPCSINFNNAKELDEIASFNNGNHNVIYGLRIVGLKSRTELKSSPEYMGLDFEVHEKLSQSLLNGDYCLKPDLTYPSLEIAKEIKSKYNDIIIASEIVDPVLQIPSIAEELGHNFLPWNPAVEQLGWSINIIGKFAKKYGLMVGIKNAKNLGISFEESEKQNKSAPMEKVWKGLATYTSIQEDKSRIIMIQRGVDDPLKGDYRNIPVHQCAKRVKQDTGYQMFFDPSHTCGPKLRDQIVNKTIEALQMKLDDGKYLYDGILVETGTSTTDTEQHITINELSNLIDEISKFREI